MHTIHLTLLFAGVLALLQCLLTALVITRRAKTGVNLMDGGDKVLLRRIRAHGNFVENVPIALLLMALLEHSGLAQIALLALGSALVIGRVLHAHGLIADYAKASISPSKTRVIGMALTIAVISIEAVLCLLFYFFN